MRLVDLLPCGFAFDLTPFRLPERWARGGGNWRFVARAKAPNTVHKLNGIIRDEAAANLHNPARRLILYGTSQGDARSPNAPGAPDRIFTQTIFLPCRWTGWHRIFVILPSRGLRSIDPFLSPDPTRLTGAQAVADGYRLLDRVAVADCLQ